MKRIVCGPLFWLALLAGVAAFAGTPATDALDKDLSILVCLDKTERAVFCGADEAVAERNAILRVIAEIDRKGFDRETGRLVTAPDWARRGIIGDDASLRSVNLAYARLLKASGALYGIADFFARGRTLEESLLSSGEPPPAFRDESAVADEAKAYYSLMEESRRDLLSTIRPGGGGAPFWNANARMFVYPPSFDFPAVAGASAYRFEVIDDIHRARLFGAGAPTAPLTPVWAELPVGFATVRCVALDATGGLVGVAGERRFWRAAPFDPMQYPHGKRICREAYRMVIDYLTGWPEIAYLEKHGRPDVSEGSNFTSYPSKMQSAVVNAMLAAAALFPERRERAMKLARISADYLLSTREKPGTPLEGFPATYVGTGQLSGTYAGQHMLVYPADAGSALLGLHAATGEEKYLDAAVAIGRTYLRLQGEDGTWYLKMNAADGSSVGPNRLVPTTVMTFLDALADATGDMAFRAAGERAFAFIERGPLSDWDWEGQFEDIRPAERRYQNLTKHMPCETALYMLRRFPGDKRRIAQARDIIRFAEDQFVVWRAPCRGDGTGPWTPEYQFFAWRTPAVLEQYNCYSPIDASSAKLIRTYMALYEAEGRALDLAKARALGSSMVNNQDGSGRIRTYWIPEPGEDDPLSGAVRLPRGGDWFNCMYADAVALRLLAEKE
jgi:maltose/maltodextrin transport system substrate-binding protein